MGAEEEMPKVPRVQFNRSNLPADTPLLYYNRSKVCTRHTWLKDINCCLKTFGELYEHVVTCIDAYPEVNEIRWNQDNDTKTLLV